MTESQQPEQGIQMNNPRVSLVQCVTRAYDMMLFSTDALYANAGTDEFDYVVVTWAATDEIKDYLNRLRHEKTNVHVIEHATVADVGYVPNLRAMMNDGFNKGFELNEYAGLVNTDMYFGKDWLINLTKHACPEDIVNSVHITRIQVQGSHVIHADLGRPCYETFDIKRFEQLYEELYKDELETEAQRGGWLGTNTMPYLIHRKFWDQCGPWELRIVNGEPPDRRFFQRCHEAGVRFTMSHSSIVYHHEAVERTDPRPVGLEGLSYE
jgi:hypothetical protein